jgi:ribosomal protein L37AE/L43A
LATYKVLRCPNCKYVWSKRGDSLPVSCPRCKKRFDYPGNTRELEQGVVGSDAIRDWLEEANRISLQCESLEEILEKLTTVDYAGM